MKIDQTFETARMTAFYRGEFSAMLGRRIIDIRAMYPEEMELFMWYGEPGCVIILEDGGLVIPTSDSEGNGVGYLTVQEGEK